MKNKLSVTSLESIIKSGDSFICAPHPEKKQSFFGWMTRRMELSDFVHAGTFYWDGRVLMCAEIRIKGKFCDQTGYVTEPAESRLRSLEKQYGSTYLVRHKNLTKASEKDIQDVLSTFSGKGYGWLKAFPIALDMSLKSWSAVCSTIPERVCDLFGHDTHDWHPSDVRENGWLIQQIL